MERSVRIVTGLLTVAADESGHRLSAADVDGENGSAAG